MSQSSCTSRYRLLGFLPLLLFGARWVELAVQGKTAHILWVCHISNLLITLGFFLCQIELIRIAVLWLIIGIPLWPIEIMRTGIVEVTSIGTHYVGLLIGLAAIWRQGMGRRSWRFALLWFLVLQQITRLIAPPAWNVNLAHAAYPGWDRLFSSYWAYWLFITTCSVIGLFALSKLLSWLPRLRRA